MKRIEGRYDSYDKDEISSLNMTRSLSPVEILNCRNKELTEILYHEIEESNAKIVALGFNKISKISYLPEKIHFINRNINLLSIKKKCIKRKIIRNHSIFVKMCTT